MPVPSQVGELDDDELPANYEEYVSLLDEYKDFKTEVKQLREDLKGKIATDEELTRFTFLVKGKKVHKKMKKMVE
jgi:hypothetical protein